MRAKKGQYVRVKEELIKDYETRGYVHNLEGYEVTNLEPAGVFIKEFGYIILHSDYEIIEEPEHVLVTIKTRCTEIMFAPADVINYWVINWAHIVMVLVTQMMKKGWLGGCFVQNVGKR